MKKNKINNKNKFLVKIMICSIFLLMIFLLMQEKANLFAVWAAEEERTESNEREFIYLSDIPYVANQSKVGWGQLLLNKAGDNNQIGVKIEGAIYTFEKGIWAHATSTVVFDLTNYPQYDYFTSYVGLNRTAASSSNGVRFEIYTSVDGKNWDKQECGLPQVTKPGDNATFVKVDIKEAKYLKLYAHDNGGNGNDHSVYADPKLIKERYKEPGEDIVPDIADLDEKIKNEFANADLTNKDYKLTLLKRELINRVGPYALKRFLSESELNKEAYSWLTGNLDILELYLLGGTPDGGNYYNSLTELARLYEEYKDDFTNTNLLNNKWYPNITYGDLYKKMAMSIALTHSQRVGLWMQSSVTQNQSDSLRRYAIFKYLHKNGKLKVNDSLDYSSWFEALQVEEMRFIMNNAIDDEEILWLNAYVQTKIDETGKTNWLTPHPHIAYVWPNYGNSVYYDEENRDYFNELFAVKKEKTDENKIGLFDLKYTIPGGKNIPTYDISVTRGTSDFKLYKVWMNFRNKFGTGAVCGGISKSGSNIRATHGIPATVIGQPGHAALLYYTKNSQGQGYWGIDNDVSGWTLSEKGERMLLGWGNASYSRGYSVVYMVLAQEAINDFDDLVKCEEEVMRASVYTGDLAKQEEIYRKALEIQPINFDAWAGLINVYNASENKTEDEYYALAEEVAENLKCFPLPMQHLTNLIKPKLTSIENTYKFTLLQTRILTEGSKLPNTATDQVLQPAITRVEANYLLGQLDKTIATFSFDGENSGKIILSSRFDGNGVRWDYSLDGKQTWNEVSFTAEEEHKLQLTPDQIASITAENDIYVHIVGVNYDEENLYKIDITQQTLPSTLYANDLENRIVGVNLNTEWRYTENDNWTSYSATSPDLTGNKTVQVRQSATGTQLTSNASPMYIFTEDNQPDTRKYIPVSHLSIHAVSTQATSHSGAATNAIDGNYNTRWHSAWNGTDTERYIIVKLDKPVSLSAVEFVPAGGGNGKILDGTIYGSMNGENWEEIAKQTNLTYTNQANTNEDAIKNTKSFEMVESKQVQYVKIVADRATNGNWFTARAFNFYQDLTRNPHPTAGVGYSTTEPTNQDVVARLINPSMEIKITNNNGSDTYTFTENGEFTFEFVNEETGAEGTATAKVNWIDKVAPTATIEYSTTSETDGEVIAKLIPNESVTVLNNGKIEIDEEGNETIISDPFIYTFMKNGEFSFEFQDKAGNIGTAIAKVDWIKEEQKPEPQPIFTSKIYRIENNLISGIQPNTQISKFKENIETNQVIELKDKAGNVLKENNVLTTGTKIKAGNVEYTAIIIGDTNGDGIADLKDILQINKHRLNKTKLTGEALLAGDANQDGKVDLSDILKINKYRLGKINEL